MQSRYTKVSQVDVDATSPRNNWRAEVGSPYVENGTYKRDLILLVEYIQWNSSNLVLPDFINGHSAEITVMGDNKVVSYEMSGPTKHKTVLTCDRTYTKLTASVRVRINVGRDPRFSRMDLPSDFESVMKLFE